jgi:hypothetical protein
MGQFLQSTVEGKGNKVSIYFQPSNQQYETFNIKEIYSSSGFGAPLLIYLVFELDEFAWHNIIYGGHHVVTGLCNMGCVHRSETLSK